MVGLTGGIGSGKSTVAARLAELGAVVIDSDRVAREVVEAGTPGLAAVVEAFGDGVLTADGSLDRAALGRLVFGDDAKRRTLEGIVHPRVRERAGEIASAAPPNAVIVNDVPLLVEAGLAANYDMVIVVLASEENRLQRLLASRGMTEADARARMAAQATDEQRRAAADIVLVNDATPGELIEAVDAAWRDQILPRAAARA